MSYRQEFAPLSYWLDHYATTPESTATIADALGLSVDDDGDGTCFGMLAAISDDPAAEWASLDQPADTLPSAEDLDEWAAAWREVFDA